MIKSPLAYSEAAELARLAGADMLAQLPWMTLKPRVVLDMGCGVGEHSGLLKQHYPDAQVFAMDISFPRVQYGKEKITSSTIHWVNAEGNCLPLPNQSVDLIFANFFLAWQQDILPLWREWRRILRPNGLLMFNLFGPDTIKEWRELFHYIWVPGMIDMHDVGDMLLQQGFCDPVLGVDYYTLTYKDKMCLVKELYHSDMFLSLPHLSSSEEEKCAVTFEIISAHAFAPACTLQNMNEDGIAKIPLAALRDNLRKL